MAKTVLITGAGRGLGWELACVFPPSEYNLILNVRKNNIAKKQRGCNVITGDITHIGTINKLAKIAEKKGVDLLINNAGIYSNHKLSEYEPFDITKTLDVNLIAPIMLTRVIWPVFVKQQSGMIVNINSIAGKHGSDGEAIYCASKYGLRGFSESLRHEATANNIRILDVYLGAMKTDMTKHREDWDKLIDPKDAALSIFESCKDYASIGHAEIDIRRREY